MRGLLLFGPRSAPGSRGLRVLNRIRRARGDLGVTDSEPQAKGTSNEECGTPFSTGIAGSTGTTLVHCTLREVQVFVCLIHQSSGLSGARLLPSREQKPEAGAATWRQPDMLTCASRRAGPGIARSMASAHSVDDGHHRTAGLALNRPTVRPHVSPLSQGAHHASHRGHPLQQRSRRGMSTRATSSDYGPIAIHARMPLCADTAREVPDTIALSGTRHPPRRRGRATTGRSGSRARSAAAGVTGGVRRDAGRREVRRRDPHVDAPQARDRQAAPREDADLVE